MNPLTSSDLRFIELLEQHFPKGSTNLRDWINSIDPVSYSRIQGVGKKKVERLIAIQKILNFQNEEKKDQTSPNSDASDFTLITVTDFLQNRTLVDTSLKNFILQTLTNLTPLKSDIFKQYFEINSSGKESTRALMERYDLTESRLSQIRKELKTNIQTNCKFDLATKEAIFSSIITLNICDYFKSVSQLTRTFRGLARLVEIHFGFHEIFAVNCDDDHSFITSDLNDIFAEHFLPMPLKDLFYILHTEYQVNKVDFWKILKRMRCDERVRLKGNDIVWAKLNSYSAVSNISLKYPEGRSSSDLYNEFLDSDLSKDTISEQNDGHFTPVIKNHYLYPIRKGFYRHRKFFSIPPSLKKKAMEAIANYTKTASRPPLTEIYQSHRELWQISECDFIELIRCEVEKGTINVNILGDKPSKSMSSTINRVLNFIDQADRPVSKEDVFNMLENYEISYINNLLNRLVSTVDIVRVSNKYYDLPKNIEKRVNVAAVKAALIDIINQQKDDLFEAEYLAEFLRTHYGMSLNKHILIYIVKHVMNGELYTRNFLISASKVNCESFLDLVRKTASEAANPKELRALIKQRVRVSDRVLNGFFASWLSAHSSELTFLSDEHTVNVVNEKTMVDELNKILSETASLPDNLGVLILLESEQACEQVRKYFLEIKITQSSLLKITVNTLSNWLFSHGIRSFNRSETEEYDISQLIERETRMYQHIYLSDRIFQKFHTLEDMSVEFKRKIHCFNIAKSRTTEIVFDSIDNLFEKILGCLREGHLDDTDLNSLNGVVVVLHNCSKLFLKTMENYINDRQSEIRIHLGPTFAQQEYTFDQIFHLTLDVSDSLPIGGLTLKAYPSRRFLETNTEYT